MNKTKHLIKRQQQRGIPNYLLKVIEENGEYLNAPGGAIKIHLGNREYQNIVHETKHFLQMLDKVKGGTIIIKDQDILTVYK
jgi:hypothetical protein